MKKIFIVALALVFTASLFPEVSAQLLSPDDCPSGVCTNEVSAYSDKQAVLTIINMVAFFSSFILIPLGLVFLVIGIVKLIRRKKPNSVKHGIIFLILGPVLALLPFIVFIVANTLIQVGMGGGRPV